MSKRFWDGAWHHVNADGSLGEKCRPPTDEERREIEAQEQRQKYQTQADATGQEVWWRGERFVPAGGGKPAPPPRPAAGTRLYKVVTQRDEFFGGKFNPEALEQLVNKLAAEGWRVVGVCTADVSTFMGSFWGGRGARQEMVVFLEKTAE